MNKPKQILCLIIALFICIQYVKPNNGKYNITTEPLSSKRVILKANFIVSN